MKCAIMQPTYLPWAGYFHLISQVGMFVFLDDVQYEKNSWQNRNRILVNGQPHWLTVPVRRLGLEQKINEVQIDDSSLWRKKHIRTLIETYAKHPHAASMLETVQPLLETSTDRLVDLNFSLIRAISGKLGL